MKLNFAEPTLGNIAGPHVLHVSLFVSTYHTSHNMHANIYLHDEKEEEDDENADF